MALDGVEGYRLRVQAVGGRDERAAVREVGEGYRGFERYHAAERAADYGAQAFYAERFERGFLREGRVARREYGESHGPAPPVSGVDGCGRGAAVGASEVVEAYYAVSPCVEGHAVADDRAPPRLRLARPAFAGELPASGQRVADEYRLVPFAVVSVGLRQRFKVRARGQRHARQDYRGVFFAHYLRLPRRRGEPSFKVGYYVARVLDADAEAQHSVGYSSGATLLRRELRVRRAGGVRDERARLAEVRGVVDHLERVYESAPSLYAAFDLDRHHAAAAVFEVDLRHVVLRMAREAGVAHPFDLRMVFEESRDFHCVFAVALHAEAERAERHAKQVGVEG